MIFGDTELAEHVAVRLAAVLKEACFQRDPTAVQARQAAKDLIRAVDARNGIDLTDLVQGALLEYSKTVRAEIEKSAARSEALAVREATRRVATAASDAAAKAQALEARRYYPND